MDLKFLEPLIFLGVIVFGSLIWLIIGLLVVGSSVLFTNISPVPHPIRILSVVIIHVILLLSCTPIIILLFGIDDKFYEFYLNTLKFKGSEMVIFSGLIPGILTYIGARIWANKIWEGSNTYILWLLRIIFSGGILFFGWLLLSWGMISGFLLTTMQGGG